MSSLEFLRIHSGVRKSSFIITYQDSNTSSRDSLYMTYTFKINIYIYIYDNTSVCTILHIYIYILK